MKEKPLVPPRPTARSADSSAVSGDRSVKLAFSALNGDYPKRESFTNENDFRSFCNVYNILRTIWRLPPHKRKDDEIKEILHEAKLPADISKEILALLRSREALEVDKYLLQVKPRLLGILDVKWRISLTIATSYISRALTPSVHLFLTLTDGRIYEVEMNLQKFHQLRHTVASILKEMQSMEALPIMQK